MKAAEIKAKNDIVRLIENDGISLFSSGPNLVCCCPFHEDHTPSLTVYPDKQWFYCYGCSVHGDCISWVMARDKVDFTTALEKLSSGNVNVPIPIRVERIVERPPHFAPFIVVDKLHNNLLNNKKAIKYLNEQKLWSTEIIRKYKIGLQVETKRFSIPIPSPITQNWGDIRLYDPLGFYNKGKNRPMEKGINNLPYFLRNNNNYLIIVEGEPDALAGASLGLNMATNTSGADNAVKVWEQWYGLVFTKNIVLCFDNDEAGQRALFGNERHRGLTQVFPMAKILSIDLGPKADLTDLIRNYGKEKVIKMIQELL